MKYEEYLKKEIKRSELFAINSWYIGSILLCMSITSIFLQYYFFGLIILIMSGFFYNDKRYWDLKKYLYQIGGRIK